MNALLDCGDLSANTVPIAGGVGFCFAHGFRPLATQGPSSPPETIAEPPPPAREKLVLTCPHCGQEFEF